MRKSILFLASFIFAFALNSAEAAIHKKKNHERTSPVSAIPMNVVHRAATNWSGFYMGLNWGVAKGTSHWSKPTGDAKLRSTDPNFTHPGAELGLLSGLTAGYNYQTGPWVLGIEGDLSFANMNSNAKCSGFVGFTIPGIARGVSWRCGTETNWIGSLAPRFGYAFDHSLLFAKMGLSYAYSDLILSYPYRNEQRDVSKATGREGLTLGVGYEYNLGGNWSAKAEYDYYHFGSKAFSGIDKKGDIYGASSALHMNVVKFGLNYRFSGDQNEAADPAFQMASDISGEFGTRIGWSGGKFSKDLWSSTRTSQFNSRLIWGGQNGVALETFTHLNHTSGFFAQGILGGVGLSTSSMSDEDFPPMMSPYSKTKSQTENGRDLYATVDLGYHFLVSPNGMLGAFIGYNHYEQNLRAYGCHQLMTNNRVCAPVGYTDDNLILGENEHWHSMRLGVRGEYWINDRLKVIGEAAWLPISRLSASDNHWLRANINPQEETGRSSKNYQLESVLSYKMTDKLSVGFGARYWHFEALGGTQFPNRTTKAPLKFESNRTTLFTQLSYSFGDEKAPGVLEQVH